MGRAARVGDAIAHSHKLAGFLIGAAIGIGIGLAIGFAVATGGLGALILGAVAGAAISYATESIGSAIGDSMMGPSTGAITVGAPTVLVNNRPLAIAMDGQASCSKEPTPNAPVAQGSEIVFAENWNAAREGDKIQCDAKITEGSDDVKIGGPQATVMEIDDGIPLWAEVLVIAAGFIGPGGVKGLFKLAGRGGLKAAIRGAGQSIRGASRAIVTGMTRARGLASAGARRMAQAARGMPGRIRQFLKDPVDMATGDWVDWRTDIAVPGVLPLELTRLHRSGAAGATGGFGRRWTDSWSQRLLHDAGQDALVWLTEDGSELAFPWPGHWGDGENPLHPGWVMEVRGPETTIRDLPSGRWWAFPTPDVEPARLALAGARARDALAPANDHAAPPAYVIAMGDAHGNRIDLDRDPAGRLRAVRHTDGHHLRVETLPDGRYLSVDLVSDPAGADFSPIRLLTCRFDARGHLTFVDARTTGIYRYETDATGRVTRWSDGGSTWSELFYDDADRVVETRAADGLYGARFAYDDAAGTVTCLADDGAVTTHTHDALGRLIRSVDPEGGVTEQIWGPRGDLEAVIDPLGRRSRYTHDRFGNLTGITHPDGSTEILDYDALGRPVAITDALGNRWRQTRDDTGRLTAAIDPEGGEMRWRYDATGRVTAIAAGPGAGQPFAVTRLSYDTAGRVTAITDPTGATSRFAYDRLGQVMVSIDPAGAVTRLQRDDRGRVVAADLPDGGRITAEYDGEGNLTRLVDPLGRETRNVYGAFDLLRETVDATGAAYRIAYDGDARPVAITNPLGETATLTWDRNGRLIAETDFGGRSWTYLRDAAGRMIERHEPDGDIRRFSYDEADRLIAEETASGIRRYGWDAAGRPVRAEEGGHVTEWRHDALGRVVAEIQDGLEVAISHAGAGPRSRVVTPWGATGFTWDPAGRLKGLTAGPGTLAFSFDALGRETLRQDPQGFTLAQSHDPAGRLTGQRVTGGADARPVVDRRWRWDVAGQPVAISDARWPEQRFTYDGRGQIARALPGRPQGSAQVEAFVYDAARNLAGRGRDLPEGAETTAARPGTPPDIAPSAGLDRWRLGPGGAILARGHTRYAYDARGRLVTRRTDRPGFRPEIWRYVWDDRDRLTGVIRPDGSRWAYGYDALDRRILRRRVDAGGKVAGGGAASAATPDAVRYLWEGDRLVAELPLDAAGRPDAARATLWHYAPGEIVPLARQQGERLWYVITDQIGLARELVTADGRLGWAAAHDPWGAVNDNATPDPDAATDCPLRFPGQWHDPETGLHYNRHRYYDPETGQYLSPDPIGLHGGPRPQAYVESPTELADPLGLKPCPTMLARGQAALRNLQPGEGLRPAMLGLETIADNPRLLQHWNDALRWAAGSKKGNFYTELLSSIEQGATPTVLDWENAFGTVNKHFKTLARSDGFNIAEVHHWNFPKGNFMTQVLDPRHLVPTATRAEHQALHTLTTGGSLWKGPIEPRHLIDIPEWSTPIQF
ncbi:RHS repeat-associated core domain-containing protein [Tistrella mobilis]|uniref:RHS repeat-associated core domain-containing protein n=1 Tax=Tistrella mobilis TaxID=171437 RepID=UPI00355685D7